MHSYQSTLQAVAEEQYYFKGGSSTAIYIVIMIMKPWVASLLLYSYSCIAS